MPPNGWLVSIETIREAVETDVFKQPGKVAKLPNALGGDPKRSDELRDLIQGSALAVNKNAFFELLWSKAHFLMLPKPIVTFMKYSSRVFVSEVPPERAGATANCKRSTDQEGKVSTEVTMHIPGASDSLARVGYCLGRACETDDPYETLATIYHEMTHAWLCLQEFSDDAIKQLYKDGGRAYAGSKGERETQFDKDIAFSEAAAAYVEDRVSRWCTALWGLAGARQDPKEVRKWKLPKIEKEYDATRLDYGVVEKEKITSPRLSPELRAAIDEKILEGRPLTKPFADTPLVGLRDALSSTLAGASPPALPFAERLQTHRGPSFRGPLG